MQPDTCTTTPRMVRRGGRFDRTPALVSLFVPIYFFRNVFPPSANVNLRRKEEANTVDHGYKGHDTAQPMS